MASEEERALRTPYGSAQLCKMRHMDAEWVKPLDKSDQLQQHQHHLIRCVSANAVAQPSQLCKAGTLLMMMLHVEGGSLLDGSGSEAVRSSCMRR